MPLTLHGTVIWDSNAVVRLTVKTRLPPSDAVAGAVKPVDVHYPHTAMVALENTHNACGGAPLTPEDTKSIADVAHAHDLPLHIDGARIFNASVYLETPVSELVKDADTVSFCLSKYSRSGMAYFRLTSARALNSATLIR